MKRREKTRPSTFNTVIGDAATDPDDAAEIIYSRVCQLSPAAVKVCSVHVATAVDFTIRRGQCEGEKKGIRKMNSKRQKLLSNCMASFVLQLYYLIKRQTMQCPFHKTAIEDWPLQEHVEPFHIQASTLKRPGWKHWKLPSLYLPSGHWLTVL